MIKLEGKIQQELDNVLNQEELIWFQRSREEWITSGDINTKFYHASTLIRRNRKKIELLRHTTGELILEPNTLESIVLEYYQNLFKEERKDLPIVEILGGFSEIAEEKILMLRKPFSKEEIKRATLEMVPFKSPGVDGLHAGFYQNLWNIVGDSLCKFVMDFFESGSLSQGVNDTLLVLIPKVQNLESLA